jgi:hypothetical protein
LPLIPQITLTATLDDLSGVAAGTVANPSRLRIALCGYGETLPAIPGTANIALVGPKEYFSTGGMLTIPLWGNDVIEPIVSGVPQTFYEIAVIDGQQNVVQCVAYQFAGTAVIDLSNATPYLPPSPPPAFTVPLNYLAVTPQPAQAEGVVYTAPGSIVMVFYNQLAQRKGIDWNPVGVSLTQFTLTFATFAEETIYALCLV